MSGAPDPGVSHFNIVVTSVGAMPVSEYSQRTVRRVTGSGVSKRLRCGLGQQIASESF